MLVASFIWRMEFQACFMQTKKNFAINALLIFFSILVGNFCNFLFNFFLARFLSVESYGIYNVLASTIFAMVVIQTPVQNYIITVLSSNISNDKENNTVINDNNN